MDRLARALVGVVILGAFVACAGPEAEETRPEVDADAPDTIEVTSDAFGADDTIPERFTCDGDDVSPPLSWSNVPEDAEELVLVVEDLDAPRGTFVHWAVAGIEPADGEVAEGQVPQGGVEATNDFEELGYRGPCPPPGEQAHEYVFAVYALSEASGFSEGESAEGLRDSIADITVASGRLSATYEREG